MPSRREVLAVASAVSLAGCDTLPIEGEPDDGETGDDQPDGTDPGGTDDPGTDVPGTDTETPTEGGDEGIELAADFDTFVSEMTIKQIAPDSDDFVHDTYTELDFANDRLYREYEMRLATEEEGEGKTFEYYVVDGKTYQLSSGRCATYDAVLVNPERVGEVKIPVAGDLAGSADFESQGTDTIDGEPVEVWRTDLSESLNVISGEMTIYVSTETGYVLLTRGSYEIGSHDNPTVFEFERRNHSFDEPLDIQVPEACEE